MKASQRPAPYKDRRVPRRDRRVMLVLLSGLDGLSGWPISQAAMVNSGQVYVVLARLETAGWVIGEPQPSGRRFYRLTLKGRMNAVRLLGLEDRTLS